MARMLLLQTESLAESLDYLLDHSPLNLQDVLRFIPSTVAVGEVKK